MLVSELLLALAGNPLLSGLELPRVELFLALARYLKPTIAYAQASYTPDPPATLPVNVQNFLVLSVGVSDEAIKHLWHAFRLDVWQHAAASTRDDEMRQAAHLIPLFLKYGLGLQLCKCTP
ncbi:hypothetical protein PsYK624_147390 [Phanerochaete sordida]|uniref:Uncharacterized protein n=1 Tax=Phanerochaete sordida TaxID=48140 RepID=A0A9P3GN49_9APHY|nr:hypothetical protein PsYK624_147390 [Phanerochaete sordida]